MAGAKKKTSVNVDQKLWKDFRKAAIDADTDITSFLEEAMRAALKKKGGK